MKKLRFTKGYETLPYDPDTQQLVKNLAQAWKSFLDQPLEEKMKLAYSNNTGYENKGPEARDYKEDFHVTLQYPVSAIPGISSVSIEFLKAAHAVLCNQNLVRSLAELLTESSDFDFVKAMIENSSSWIVRCLYYPPQEKEIIAAEHPDKGPATIHVYDSTPGLQGWINGKWEYMVFDHTSEAVGYPGLLGQFHSKCTVKALPHRVISTSTSRKEGRISIVIFVDFPGKVIYNKAKFGPTQDVFKEGSNTVMNFEEFSQYFLKDAVEVDA